VAVARVPVVCVTVRRGKGPCGPGTGWLTH
jgi:hypothetical protein